MFYFLCLCLWQFYSDCSEIHNEIFSEYIDIFLHFKYNQTVENFKEEEKMAFCPNCGTQNADSAQFCEKCGTQLVAQQPVNNQQQNQPTNQPMVPGKGFAITSLVCGIVSFFCFAIILGILAIVFGSVAKSKGYKGGMATAGIVLGIVGMALYVLMILFWKDFTLFNIKF